MLFSFHTKAKRLTKMENYEKKTNYLKIKKILDSSIGIKFETDKYNVYNFIKCAYDKINKNLIRNDDFKKIKDDIDDEQNIEFKRKITFSLN